MQVQDFSGFSDTNPKLKDSKTHKNVPSWSGYFYKTSQEHIIHNNSTLKLDEKKAIKGKYCKQKLHLMDNIQWFPHFKKSLSYVYQLN